MATFLTDEELADSVRRSDRIVRDALPYHKQIERVPMAAYVLWHVIQRTIAEKEK